MRTQQMFWETSLQRINFIHTQTQPMTVSLSMHCPWRQFHLAEQTAMGSEVGEMLCPTPAQLPTATSHFCHCSWRFAHLPLHQGEHL